MEPPWSWFSKGSWPRRCLQHRKESIKVALHKSKLSLSHRHPLWNIRRSMGEPQITPHLKNPSGLSFQYTMLEALDSHMQKHETRPHLSPYKVSAEWIRHPNLSPETMKLRDKTWAECFWTFERATAALRLYPKSTGNRIRDFIKLKIFCRVKEAVNRMRRQHTGWNKHL